MRKSGNKPTKRQKLLIEQNCLNPHNWLVVKNPPGEIQIKHRLSGNMKVIKFG